MNRKMAITLVGLLLVMGGGAWYYTHIQEERSEKLLSFSEAQLSSEERSELRAIRRDPEETRRVLIQINKAKERFWIADLEHCASVIEREMTDLKAGKIYNLEASRKRVHEYIDKMTEARAQITGFNRASGRLQGYRFGMTKDEQDALELDTELAAVKMASALVQPKFD